MLTDARGMFLDGDKAAATDIAEEAAQFKLFPCGEDQTRTQVKTGLVTGTGAPSR